MKQFSLSTFFSVILFVVDPDNEVGVLIEKGFSEQSIEVFVVDPDNEVGVLIEKGFSEQSIEVL